MSGDLSDGMEVGTVQGTKLTIHHKDGTVHINKAEVVTADVETRKGVVHVINSVLLPA